MQAGSGHGVSALIISPTRELAQQIAVEATSLGTYHKLNVQVLTHASFHSESLLGDLEYLLLASVHVSTNHCGYTVSDMYFYHAFTACCRQHH